MIDGYGTAASTATVAYGAASNLLSETTAQSATATYAHPSTTSHGHDALNRQARQIDSYGTAVASTTTLLSDAAGNLLSQATGRSATFTYAHPETTGYAYGALNRRTQTALAFGVAGQQRTEAPAYDAAGNLLADTPPSGHPTSYAYDALNRRVSSSDPPGHTTTAYDTRFAAGPARRRVGRGLALLGLGQHRSQVAPPARGGRLARGRGQTVRLGILAIKQAV